MTERTVTALYAELARAKSQWAYSPSLADGQQHLDAGGPLGDALMAARATSLSEVLMKLAELEEWFDSDGTQSQRQMTHSVILDIAALMQDSGQSPPAEITTEAPSAASADPPLPVSPVVFIDRRARPVNINGKWYGSITDAARVLNVSYSALRKMTLGAMSIDVPA